MRYQFIVLLVSCSLLLFSSAVFSLSLDDDEEDKEDVADYVIEAKKASDNKSLDEAQDLLKKAGNIGVLSKEVDEAKTFISKREESLAYIKQARSKADQQQFTEAKKALEKAETLGLFKSDTESASAYIASKQQDYREQLASAAADRARQQANQAQQGSSISTSASVDWVNVRVDWACGFFKRCFTDKNLYVNGPGYVSFDNGKETSQTVNRMIGALAGQYTFSVSANKGKIACSGSFYLSGTKHNYTIVLHDNCSDAGSGEY